MPDQRRPQRRLSVLAWMLGLAALLLATAARAQEPERGGADLDSDPRVKAWDAFGGVLLLLGQRYRFASSLDELELAPKKSLLVILGRGSHFVGWSWRLQSFTERGGRVLIASDQSSVDPALEAFGLGIGPCVVRARGPKALPTLDGYDDCPIVPVRGLKHPIFRQLDEIIFNRAAVFAYQGLDSPALSWPEGTSHEGNPVIAARRRGKGRYVAIADQSVFINAMLVPRAGANRRFLESCLEYLEDLDGVLLENRPSVSQVAVYVDGEPQSPPRGAMPPLPPGLPGAIALLNLFLDEMQRSSIWNRLLDQFSREAYFWLDSERGLLISSLLLAFVIQLVLRRRGTAAMKFHVPEAAASEMALRRELGTLSLMPVEMAREASQEALRLLALQLGCAADREAIGASLGSRAGGAAAWKELCKRLDRIPKKGKLSKRKMHEIWAAMARCFSIADEVMAAPAARPS